MLIISLFIQSKIWVQVIHSLFQHFIKMETSSINDTFLVILSFVASLFNSVKNIKTEIAKLVASIVQLESRTWSQRKTLNEVVDEMREEVRCLKRDISLLKYRLDKRKRKKVVKRRQVKTTTSSSSTTTKTPRAQSSKRNRWRRWRRWRLYIRFTKLQCNADVFSIRFTKYNTIQCRCQC